MTPASAVRSMPLVTLTIMLGIVAARAAPVVWHWQGEVAVDSGPVAMPTAASPEMAVPPVDIGPILALAPFGSVPVAAEPVRPLGETTLDLVLLGVVVRSDPALSRAMIDASGTVGQFGPQDPINAGAVLVEVAQDHVILQVDGALQTLSFPVADADGTAPGLPESGTARLAAAIAGQTAAVESDPAPATPEDYINLWRERIRANPGEVLTAIGLIATPDGYVIADQHDSGVQRAGLRAGDLVRSVNGQPVGNVDDDRRLYDEVAASGMARIEIERDGRTIVMSFPLQ
jgi:general secretion pathway protein C